LFFDHDLKGDNLPPKTLCLTYDDGPGADTLELGRYLFEEGIPATFFVIGRHAEERREVLPRLRDCGHRIGNHTWSHPGLVALAEVGGDLVSEIARTDALIRPYARDGSAMLRAPYGNWRQKRPGTDEDCDRSIVATILNESGCFAGYIGPINWDISAADYDFWKRGASAEDSAAAYLQRIRQTSRGIVLMHDSSEDPAVQPRNRALQATRLMVPKLKAEGYRFVDLKEVPTIKRRTQ
jgi:peptidoglycan/xylan/chitin deacetylase (PgdA/CDA1 family)